MIINMTPLPRRLFSLSAFFNNIDEAGLYSYFTGSVPPQLLNWEIFRVIKKIRQAEAKLEQILKSNETKQAWAEWKKEVQMEKIGYATYFSKALPSIEKAEGNIDILSLKPSLWLDASDLNQTAGDWPDKSGNQNHAQKVASAKIEAHKRSGLKVMKYNSNSNDYHQFKEINNIRTVFWVMSKTSR